MIIMCLKQKTSLCNRSKRRMKSTQSIMINPLSFRKDMVFKLWTRSNIYAFFLILIISSIPFIFIIYVLEQLNYHRELSANFFQNSLTQRLAQVYLNCSGNINYAKLTLCNVFMPFINMQFFRKQQVDPRGGGQCKIACELFSSYMGNRIAL